MAPAEAVNDALRTAVGNPINTDPMLSQMVTDVLQIDHFMKCLINRATAEGLRFTDSRSILHQVLAYLLDGKVAAVFVVNSSLTRATGREGKFAPPGAEGPPAPVNLDHRELVPDHSGENPTLKERNKPMQRDTRSSSEKGDKPTAKKPVVPVKDNAVKLPGFVAITEILTPVAEIYRLDRSPSEDLPSSLKAKYGIRT